MTFLEALKIYQRKGCKYISLGVGKSNTINYKSTDDDGNLHLYFPNAPSQFGDGIRLTTNDFLSERWGIDGNVPSLDEIKEKEDMKVDLNQGLSSLPLSPKFKIAE